MVNSMYSISSQLSSIYTSNSRSLAEIYQQVASGKKITSASDDFVGYIRAQSYESDINDYEGVQEDLYDAKIITEMTVDVGDGIYEDLYRMKTIADAYDTASADQQDAYESEFAALMISVTSAIGDAQYEGTNLIQSAAAIRTVYLDPDRSNSLSIQFAAGDIVTSANITALDLAGNGGAATSTSVATELTAAQNYVSKANMFDTAVDRNQDIVDNIVANKQAAKSYITDVDDVEALAKATDLQVRQQATIAMMAQSNLSRESLMLLFK